MESYPLEIEFLTVEEVCEMCHVSRQTLHAWGLNPFLCFPPKLKLNPGKGGAVRYRLSHMVEWTEWLRSKANAKAAGQDPKLIPPPSYTTSGAYQSGVLKLEPRSRCNTQAEVPEPSYQTKG